MAEKCKHTWEEWAGTIDNLDGTPVKEHRFFMCSYCFATRKPRWREMTSQDIANGFAYMGRQLVIAGVIFTAGLVIGGGITALLFILL